MNFPRKCLLKVLRPVRRPITTMDCVLLKDNNRALVARSGPEIICRASLCVLHGPRHNTRCWFCIQRFISLLIFCLETPEKSSGPSNLWTELSCEVVGDFISSYPSIDGTPEPVWTLWIWDKPLATTVNGTRISRPSSPRPSHNTDRAVTQTRL